MHCANYPEQGRKVKATGVVKVLIDEGIIAVLSLHQEPLVCGASGKTGKTRSIDTVRMETPGDAAVVMSDGVAHIKTLGRAEANLEQITTNCTLFSQSYQMIEIMVPRKTY